jgi:heme/copper-type cytochrome/quinol oxidase subunit 2
VNKLIIIAIVLIVAGVLGLVYGKFSYTQDTERAKLGPIELTVKENRTVNIPVWAGAGSIAAGAAVLLFGAYKTK